MLLVIRRAPPAMLSLSLSIYIYIYIYIYKHATLSDSQYPLGYLIHSFSLRGGRSLSRAGAHTH